MQRNRMRVFAFQNKNHPEHDTRNLFALRWDLHALLFDQAKWVVVPKDGQMVIHFISQSFEAAALYHNRRFDTTKLSHEFLFSRFAWAIIEQVKSAITPEVRRYFNLIVSIPTSESPEGEPQVGPSESSVGTSRKKRKVDDAALGLDVNDFQVNEAQELKEDLKLAKRVAPFFCKFAVSSMLPQLILSLKLKNLTCDITSTMK
jgi:hypothetical protein